MTASAGQDVCVLVGGNYVPGQGSGSIQAARGAFDRTVVNSSPGSSGVIETATDYVNVQGCTSKTQGHNVEVEIYNQASTSEGGGRGQVIKPIASGGAMLPEIGSMFGAVSFLCSGVEDVDFLGEATG